jgi:superfamily II helicase
VKSLEDKVKLMWKKATSVRLSATAGNPEELMQWLIAPMELDTFMAGSVPV